MVLDPERVLNGDGLRFPDELVRHKVLDLIGDLSLLGLPLEGHVVVEKGGHSLHQRLLAEILATVMIKRKQDCEARLVDTQTETSRFAEGPVKYWSQLKKRRRRPDVHPLRDIPGSDLR